MPCGAHLWPRAHWHDGQVSVETPQRGHFGGRNWHHLPVRGVRAPASTPHTQPAPWGLASGQDEAWHPCSWAVMNMTVEEGLDQRRWAQTAPVLFSALQFPACCGRWRLVPPGLTGPPALQGPALGANPGPARVEEHSLGGLMEVKLLWTWS